VQKSVCPHGFRPGCLKRQSQCGYACRRSVLWIDLWTAVERPVRNADFHQQDSTGAAAIAIVARGAF
jgi:hypothetical protein